MRAIKVSHLRKSYGHKQVLTDVNLEFEVGKIYALLGRNGVGKSTLLKIIANQILKSGGSVSLDGEELQDNERLLNDVYLMGPQTLWAPDRNVKWIFNITKQFYGGFDDEYAAHLVKVFKLDTKKRLAQLSTGYKTIAKLIVALCVPSAFILLDEPVLGLDAPNRELFYDELLATYGKRPRTFVIATHLIEEIATLVEDVTVIADGQVLLADTAEHIAASAHTITGPAQKVVEFTAGTTPLQTHHRGAVTTISTLANLDGREVPAGVTVKTLPLQQLFIALTAGGQDDE
ncbi:MAG: ABC transporter ATP-binding protein [Lacticaseibacillus songhuajiangensis]|jgi:ABC-2 type transport system ATP-binding protein|nr:ABC transporter ATP-binding protein [Lacticaseibacillus songhuajiangensis]